MARFELLTGEARPQLRRAGDVLTGGSFNLGNPLVMRVTAAGDATRLAAILRLAERAAAERPRLALVAALRDLILDIADLSEIVTES